MRWKTVAAGISALVLLQGCAGTPAGPTVQVMPGEKKSFEEFAQDQAICKQYANDQTAGQADSANTRAIGATLLGAGLGAGLGAAVGGGRGAAIGAASGGVVGTAVGAGSSSHGQLSIQQQYNNAFASCMTAKGNRVQQPVVVQQAPIIVQQPPPVVYAPPPPPPVVYYPAPPPTVYAPAPPY